MPFPRGKPRRFPEPHLSLTPDLVPSRAGAVSLSWMRTQPFPAPGQPPMIGSRRPRCPRRADDSQGIEGGGSCQGLQHKMLWLCNDPAQHAEFATAYAVHVNVEKVCHLGCPAAIKKDSIPPLDGASRIGPSVHTDVVRS